MYHPARIIPPLIAFALGFLMVWPLPAADDPAIFPVGDIKLGMKGVAYTIFSGDQVDKMDVEVLGVLHNVLGPKQDVILVQLKGPQVEHTGVVAGMSGSPVYFDGKLAGAIALKLGAFAKEAIAGVTPIASMLEVEKVLTPATGPPPTARIPLPREFARARRADAAPASYLVPIETPLVLSGLQPETLTQFGTQLDSLGVTAMAGGSVPASPTDADLKPGDMVGMGLVGGDLNLSAGCTVTAIVGKRVFACGHPLFGFGNVEMPLSRAHVVTTLASSLNSIKIISTGGVIGTLTEDRTTAVMGRLGAGPQMIPLDVSLTTPAEEKRFHFDVINSPQLTPLLVAIATFNGIAVNPAYSENTTLELQGSIELKRHAPVELENLFPPADIPAGGSIAVAMQVQSIFARLFANPFERPDVDKIRLHVTSLPERRSAIIEGAWSEKNEVTPGETVNVKVLLRPYRGAPFVQEMQATIPQQAAPGPVELLISDADTLNRRTQGFFGPAASQLSGLEELIRLLNRERRNDRLYAALFQPVPTLLIEDKELPNVPLSQIDVLDQRHSVGGARLLWQSLAGEWSVRMNQAIAGQHAVTITVK